MHSDRKKFQSILIYSRLLGKRNIIFYLLSCNIIFPILYMHIYNTRRSRKAEFSEEKIC